MTKYRIVKFDNGKFGIQQHDGFMCGWRTKFDEFESVEQAQAVINRFEDFDKRWDASKKRKVSEIIG